MQIKLRTTEKNIIETGEFFNPSLDIQMTSREIAKLTGKKHSDVMRDIRAMFKGLEDNADLHSAPYIHNSRKYNQYKLSKNYILCLVSGYSSKLRMQIIQRLEKLENNYHNSIVNNMSLLGKQIKANGKDWGKMGVDQRLAKRDYGYIEKEVKKLIQPTLDLGEL